MQDSRSYRADIDGLRGIAVAAVVLHHADGLLAPGGYIGVDIFFVISGYLIGGMLLQEAQSGRIDLLGFYHRRIIRIIPAYAATLAISYLVGLLVLTPKELLQLTASLASALLFASNFYFARSVDYFDAQSAENPLLHMWSLSVEEQFYIVFPLLLILLIRLPYRFIRPVLIGLLLASLLACVIAVDARRAYFWPHTRAPELLFGVIAASVGAKQLVDARWRGAANLFALTTIIVSVFVFDKNTATPTLWPLIPCAACALLLINRPGERETAGWLLTAKPLVGVGLISYSLYLVHWPLFIYARKIGYGVDDASQIGLLIVGAGALAAASWYAVEQPVRRMRWRGARFSGRLLGATTAALALALLPTWLMGGLPNRFEPQVRALLDDGWTRLPHMNCMRSAQKAASGNSAEGAALSSCKIGILGAPASVVLWGDSHAASLLPAVDDAIKQRRLGGIAYLHAGCPPLPGIRWAVSPARAELCGPLNERVLEAVGGDVRLVIIHARWLPPIEGGLGEQKRIYPTPRRGEIELAVAHLGERVASLRDVLSARGVQLVVVGPSPDFGVNIRTVVARHLHAGTPISDGPLLRDVKERQSRTVNALRSGLSDPGRFIDLTDIVCRGDRCPIAEGAHPLYNDYDHITADHARRAVGAILSQLDRLSQP